jgi:hypothetical protein
MRLPASNAADMIGARRQQSPIYKGDDKEYEQKHAAVADI